MSLDLSKDGVTWVASKLSSAAEELGEEALKIKNWLLRFGCASEELWVEVSGLVGFLGKYPPPPGQITEP